MAKAPHPSSKGDAAAMKLRDHVRSLGEVLSPKNAPEPILAPSVRQAVFEWLTELNAEAELEKVDLKARSSCLLYGPPGTGKTTLAHHLAARLGIPMVVVGAENLIDKWLGASGKNVADLFKGLREAEERCVLFIDEIDAIGASRDNCGGQGADNERRTTMSVLLRNVEQFNGIMVAATNLPDVIDSALWRRFGMQISVDRPGFDERWSIIAKYLHPYRWEDDAISQLADYTEGAPPSLLRQLCEGAKRALVLGPRIRRPIDSAAAVLKPIITSIAVHPSYTPPPLWHETDRCITGLSAYSWPPEIGGDQ